MLHHGGMHAADAGVLPECMERCDVAVADDRLACTADKFKRDHVENLHAAIAAARTPDDIYIVVLEGVEQILRTLLGGAGETTVAALCVSSYCNLMAPGLQCPGAVIDEASLDGTCWRNNSDMHKGEN